MATGALAVTRQNDELDASRIYLQGVGHLRNQPQDKNKSHDVVVVMAVAARLG